MTPWLAKFPYPSNTAGAASFAPWCPIHAHSSVKPGVPLCVSVLPMKPRRYGLTPRRSSSFKPASSAPRT